MPDFTAFAFPATDASADRTTPDRLSDIVNVKDWGATGDGETDDTAAIQAAVDYAWSLPTAAFRHGSIVFIPPGTYRIDSGPLNLHTSMSVSGTASLSVEGCGMDVSILRGDYAGVLVQTLSVGFSGAYSKGNMRHFTIWNESQASGSGAFYMESCGNYVTFSHVHFKGVNGFRWGNNVYPCTLNSCKATSSVPPNAANEAAQWPPFGSVGIMATHGELVNCQVEGFDIGISHLPFIFAAGNRISRCNHGIFGGYRNAMSNINQIQYNSTTTANIIDRCKTGVYCASGSGSCYIGNIIKGTDGVRDAASCTLSWSGGFATATVSGGHNLQVNELQAINFVSPVDAVVSGGTYTLTFGGQTTSSIAYNASPATVEAALEALSSIGSGNVSCSAGGFPSPILVEFTGTLARASQATMTGTSSLLPSGSALAIERERGGGLTTSLLLVTDPVGWTPDGTGAQIRTVTWASATTFTYALTSNPGSFVSATWNYALDHALSFRVVSSFLIAGNQLDALVSSSIDLVGPGSATHNQQRNLIISQRAPYDWIEPHVQGMAGWTLINCEGKAVFMPSLASLPGGVGVGMTLATEGMEYTITDANVSGAAFGATVVGGSNLNYKVRYNGTNWIRVG